MGIFSFIGDIFSPAAKLVDSLSTTDEEKLKLRNELAKIQETAMSKMMDLQAKAMEAQSKVSVAEANSKHTITAIWRPVTSLILVALIVLGSFGWVTLNEQIYELAQWMLGGYAAGRSVEKFGAALKLGK